MTQSYDFSGTHFDTASVPYPVPPYQYRDNEMFTLKLEVDGDYLRSLVPEPMVVNRKNIMGIYIGWQHVVEPTVVSYGEAGIMVPVRLGDQAGTYMPVLYLDEIELLTSGREVWGFPKFAGEVNFERDQQGVCASVSNGGVKLIDMRMTFERACDPVVIDNQQHFLLKTIPSVTGEGYDVRQINSCRVRNDDRREIWEGEATLKLQSNATNPLGDIPLRRVISAVYTRGDILLDRGEVVHDYLAAGQG